MGDHIFLLGLQPQSGAADWGIDLTVWYIYQQHTVIHIDPGNEDGGLWYVGFWHNTETGDHPRTF
jgi:hypothetical protein